MNPRLFLSGLLIYCASAQAAAPGAKLELKGPSGGWTNSTLTDNAGRITYAYPNNLIDRGGQRYRTLIEGKLKRLAGAKRTPALIVNGNVMPLYTDQHGNFARPYVFGPGSNSVEIRDPEGNLDKRIQFYESNAGKPTAQIRIILSWDDPQAELDLHIITPDGQHAFWAEPILSTGGGLDVDSVDGSGPEMFSITAPMPGTYQVYVNYWGNFGTSGYHFDESTRQRDVIVARLTLVFDENTPAERRETLSIPTRKIGELVLAKQFRRAD